MIEDYIELQKKVYERKIYTVSELGKVPGTKKAQEMFLAMNYQILEKVEKVLDENVVDIKHVKICEKCTDSACSRSDNAKDECINEKIDYAILEGLEDVVVEIIGYGGTERVVLFDPAEAE